MSRLSTPWARVHLARGRSSGDLWEVDRSTSGARIDVGTSPNCVWQLHAEGVKPFHLEMYWDGEVLWVADLEGAKVRIDGQVVDDWYATAHGTRIELGQATLRVETSQQEFDDPHVADRPDEATVAGPNRTFGDTATDVSAPADGLHDAPTRVAAGAESALAAAERAARGELLEGDPTRASAPRGKDAAVFGGAAAADPNATRLVQTPESRLEGAPGVPIHRRPPPPRIGVGARNVRRAPSPEVAPASRRRSEPPRSAPPPPPPPPAPPSAPPRSAPSASTPPAASEPTPGAAPSAAAQGKPKFAAPPPLDAGDGKRRKATKGDGPKKPVIGGKEMALPPRTWALLAVTVGALAFVILMEDEPPAEPPPAPVAAETATDDGQDAGEGDEEHEAADGQDGPPRELGARPTEATDSPPEEGVEEPRQEEDEVDRTLVRRAVDSIMDGRSQEALELYRQLAEAQPEEPAFAAIVEILEDRVGDCEEEPCD